MSFTFCFSVTTTISTKCVAGSNKAIALIPAPKIVINMSATFILPAMLSNYPSSYNCMCNSYFFITILFSQHDELKRDLLLTYHLGSSTNELLTYSQLIQVCDGKLYLCFYFYLRHVCADYQKFIIASCSLS